MLSSGGEGGTRVRDVRARGIEGLLAGSDDVVDPPVAFSNKDRAF